MPLQEYVPSVFLLIVSTEFDSESADQRSMRSRNVERCNIGNYEFRSIEPNQKKRDNEEECEYGVEA